MNLGITETQSEKAVVVLNDIVKRCETPVVVEASLRVRPESFQRSRAVALVGRAIRLKIVDSDLSRRVKIPSGLGK